MGPGIGPGAGPAVADGRRAGPGLLLGGHSSIEVDNIRKKTLVTRTGQDLRRRRTALPRNGVLEAYMIKFTTHQALDGPVPDDAAKVDGPVVSY